MEKSFYIVTFPDGSTSHSNDVSWHKYAVQVKATKLGNPKLIYASCVPIKSVHVFHNGLEKDLEVPKDCRVYQAIAARTVFSGEKGFTEISGRIIGLMKDDIIIEEYVLNGEANTVTGFKI